MSKTHSSFIKSDLLVLMTYLHFPGEDLVQLNISLTNDLHKGIKVRDTL